VHCQGRDPRWLRGSADRELLASWHLPRKSGWAEYVNAPQTEAELAAVHRSVHRGSPFSDESWSKRATRRHGLESTTRTFWRSTTAAPTAERKSSQSLRKPTACGSCGLASNVDLFVVRRQLLQRTTNNGPLTTDHLPLPQNVIHLIRHTHVFCRKRLRAVGLREVTQVV
jgi:hypothetical protein